MENTISQPITETLVELGLSENDAMLYQILLKYPEATIVQLQQKSPFKRTMLYYILESLQDVDLVYTKKRGKKTVYIAESPAKLDQFMRDREKDLRKQKDMLAEVMKQMHGTYMLAHNKPGVRFFEGPEGFEEALRDTLTTKETLRTIVDFSSIRYVEEINARYVKQRRALGIEKKILVPHAPENIAFGKKLGSALTDTKYFPKGLNPFGTGMQIYDNKISYFTLRKEFIIAIIIEDKHIYEMHKNIFDYFWEHNSVSLA